jgi:hypothetical protein
MKATTTSSTLPLAKPAKALAGATVPVITVSATASIAAVRRGNAARMTDTMAETKMAKRCQASRVSPAGTGVNQMPRNSRSDTPRLTRRPLAAPARLIGSRRPRPAWPAP